MERQEIRGSPVQENGVCPLWEKSELPGVAILHECWFCKWSDFRDDLDEYRHIGICRNPERTKNQEEER